MVLFAEMYSLRPAVGGDARRPSVAAARRSCKGSSAPVSSGQAASKTVPGFLNFNWPCSQFSVCIERDVNMWASQAAELQKLQVVMEVTINRGMERPCTSVYLHDPAEYKS